MSEQPASTTTTTETPALSEQKEALPQQPAESVTNPPPVTRRHITGVVILALTLSVIIIIPGIIADYLTAQYLKPKAPAAKHPNDTRWRDLVRRRGVAIMYQGKHKTTLRGWLLRPLRPHQRLVIYLHDFSRDHRDGYDLVRDLLKNGLNVFVLDMRAHGKSEGRIGRNVQLITGDLQITLNYLRRLYPGQWNMPIAVIGEGLGGSVALLAATRDGGFRTVIALNPPLDPQQQLKQQLKGYPNLLVNLTLQRVERVASMRYHHSSVLQNAHRLRDTTVMILGSSQPSVQRSYQQFCSKTRGTCTYASVHEARPNQWWGSLPSKRQDAIMVFLLQRLNIPVAKYRLSLRPHIRTKTHRPRTRPTARRKPRKPTIRPRAHKPATQRKPHKPATRREAARSRKPATQNKPRKPASKPQLPQGGLIKRVIPAPRHKPPGVREARTLRRTPPSVRTGRMIPGILPGQAGPRLPTVKAPPSGRGMIILRASGRIKPRPTSRSTTQPTQRSR